MVAVRKKLETVDLLLHYEPRLLLLIASRRSKQAFLRVLVLQSMASGPFVALVVFYPAWVPRFLASSRAIIRLLCPLLLRSTEFWL